MPFLKDFLTRGKPKESYDFTIIIKDMDYSAELIGVRIISSIYVPYLIYVLEFILDSNNLIQEKIYGQDPIKFTLRSLGDIGFLMETIESELIVIHSAFLLTQRQDNQIDKTKFQVVCVERKNFLIASKLVNAIYNGVTVKEIIEDMAKKLSIKAEVDEHGINKTKYAQVLIPPVSITSAIKTYIDKIYGIYNGPYQTKIEHNENSKLIIRNLSQRIQESPQVIIHQIAPNNAQNMSIIEKCGDGVNFYTYEIHRSNFNANPVFGVFGTVSKHIFKPLNTLVKMVTNRLDDVCKNAGLMSKKDANIPYDEILKERTRYYHHTEYSTQAMLSRRISGLANLTMRIERAFKIHNILNVGRCVKFNTYTMEYANLAGNYVLSGSDLIFHKQKTLQWDSFAKIKIIRSHKEIV